MAMEAIIIHAPAVRTVTSPRYRANSYGCFPARFVFGLFLSVAALERWFDRTGRDLSTFILFMSFFVGHWWQGRLEEGLWLFALFLGFTLSPLCRRAP